MLYFPVAIIPEEGGDYGVIVPDLPGCFSVGDDLEEAIASAQEAIECHIEGMMMDDEPIPFAQALDAHRHNPEYVDATWAIIPLDVNKLSGKAKRINITLSESVLRKIDAFAAQNGESRSGLLQSAAIAYMSASLSK